MNLILLALRLCLAVIFGVAGFGKLLDRQGSIKAVRDFGVPAGLAPMIGQALPVIEIACGLALLARPTAWWGALGAELLLVGFIIGMAYNVALRRAPDCHCFGSLHSEPVSWRSILRNIVFAGAALVILWQGRVDPGASLVGWIGSLSGAERILLALLTLISGALAGAGVALFHILKQQGRLLERIEALEKSDARMQPAMAQTPSAQPAKNTAKGLPLDAVAPTFHLTDLANSAITLETLRASGKPVALVFADPGCGPCNALLPDLARYQRASADKLTLAIVSRGDIEKNHAKAEEFHLDHVLLQRDFEVAQAYGVLGTPSAVLVRPDGVIGSAVAEGADQIRLLIATALGRPANVPLPMAPSHHNHKSAQSSENGFLPFPVKQASTHIGSSAPALRLPDLAGAEHDLRDFHGRETMVLFWNPTCGYCQRLLPELKAWENNQREDAPRLVIVTTGDSAANRAQGLQSLMLYDATFATGSAFGVFGTPTGMLIDADGNIAADPAIGGKAVMELLTNRQPVG